MKGSLNSDLNYAVTLFDVQWDEFQTTLVSPFGVSYVDNVPGASSTGLELEANGAIGDSTTYVLSYAWTDADVSQPFETAIGDPTSVVAKGTRLPGSPEHSLFAGIAFTQELSGSALSYRADMSYQSETFSSFGDFPSIPTSNYIEFPSFTVWNASVTWEKDNYSIRLFGKNLTNERGTSLGIDEQFLGVRDQGLGVIVPRTWGLRFDWSYN